MAFWGGVIVQSIRNPVELKCEPFAKIQRDAGAAALAIAQACRRHIAFKSRKY
jgi:hypothetical protein